MKRKAFDRQRDRALAQFLAWQTMLGLRWWRIEYNWHDTGSSLFEREAGTTCYATTTTQWEYLRAQIDINTPALRHQDDDDLEYTVVHELCHVLVAEMRGTDWNRQHEERVVTTLAKAFLWVRDLTRDAARDEGPDLDSVRALLLGGLGGDYTDMRRSAEQALARLSGTEVPEGRSA